MAKMFHVKHSRHILLINPWITDFAAYNLWVKPVGLLYIASSFKGKWISGHPDRLPRFSCQKEGIWRWEIL